MKASLYAHPAGALTSALSSREAQTSQTPLLSWSSGRKTQDPKFFVLPEQRAGTKQIKGRAPREGQRSDTEHQGGLPQPRLHAHPAHTQDTHRTLPSAHTGSHTCVLNPWCTQMTRPRCKCREDPGAIKVPLKPPSGPTLSSGLFTLCPIQICMHTHSCTLRPKAQETGCKVDLVITRVKIRGRAKATRAPRERHPVPTGPVSSLLPPAPHHPRLGPLRPSAW